MATANPTTYPLSAPQVSGDQISVSTLLAQPTRITRYLSDLSLLGGAAIPNVVLRRDILVSIETISFLAMYETRKFRCSPIGAITLSG